MTRPELPRVAGPGHILVLGTSKTGTTGLYSSIKHGLRSAGVDALTLFEPNSAEVLDNAFLLAPNHTVLAKTTMNHQLEVVPDPLVFDHRLMTVRDPRDVLISSLLFRPLTRKSLANANSAAVAQFVRALEQKEADPGSLSVRELFELADALGIGNPPYAGLAKTMARQSVLLTRFEFHVVRYEDFVQDRLEPLSAYLGFPVQNVADSSSAVFGHISRSTSSGAFLDWFHTDDVAYFDDLFGDALTAFGYPRDVALAEHPTIDPETSSRYVESRYRERRERLATIDRGREVAWSPLTVNSADELERISHFAEDGDALSCLQMAQVLLGGHLGEPNEAAALAWSRAAAQLGRREGMRLTAELLERVGPADPAARREARTWRAEARVRDERAEAQANALSLAGDLRGLQNSMSTRVGAQLVELARSPRRNGPRAARELISLWRGRARR